MHRCSVGTEAPGGSRPWESRTVAAAVGVRPSRLPARPWPSLSPAGNGSCLLAPGAVWSAASLGEGALCRQRPPWVPSWLRPHKYPRAGGRATQRQARTMGRLELVVLGLTCCSAVVSGAKVSDSPAQEAGDPLSSCSTRPGHCGGQAKRRGGRQTSRRQKEPAPVSAALPGA